MHGLMNDPHKYWLRWTARFIPNSLIEFQPGYTQQLPQNFLNWDTSETEHFVVCHVTMIAQIIDNRVQDRISVEWSTSCWVFVSISKKQKMEKMKVIRSCNFAL